ncbi:MULTISPECIES: SPFH domain-containing protein [unclassified Coleofasciculus]|uniref:SPFH domain-containing protein n=1 Tax=unclassified Coleofasciculus TaxID=2692782 RepID=UPI001881CD5C|nr:MULTISPECIES: stomatin-like protein [unclassified Coleofasciculus]MBE9127867.1 paraslipin [Coleofasciculus sp. LEGE 07081]MBE9149639.1 paraslipin [Coleofasciculus sp. LEGE 07092]
MDTLLSILAPMILVIVGYSVGSTKVVNQGTKALVERLGKYHRQLDPGLNFIVPFLDRIAVEETTREQVLDIEPQQAITKDNISVIVDAVVFWRIKELYKAYYDVEDVEEAIKNLVTTTLRSEIGELDLDQTYSSRTGINQNLSVYLQEAADSWGIEVIRVEVQEIKPPQTVLDSLEKERAAESEKQAAIFEAEGEREATIARAEGSVKSIEIISKAIQGQSNSREVLQYLIAQQYVDANQKLGESPNSKVVFMDPKALTEAMTDLLGGDTDTPIDRKGNGSIKPPDSIKPPEQ